MGRVSAPTVYQRSGFWVMVLKLDSEDGAAELTAFVSPALGTGWEQLESPDLERISRQRNNLVTRTEISSASLSVHNSSYRLYFAERIGTRWKIQMLASDELLLWRHFGEVFENSLASTEFDFIGVLEPDVVSVGDQVHMYYEGTDALSSVIGVLTRSAASDSVP